MRSAVIAILAVACWCTVVFAGTSEKVRISYHDGTEYIVSNFAFYTDHQSVHGFYIASTTDSFQPLLVKTEKKLWQEVKGEDVATLRLEGDANKGVIEAHIELKGGQTVRGVVPLRVTETWDSGEYFWIKGITTKFGKPASFKWRLGEVALIKTVKGSSKSFSFKNVKGDEKNAEAVEFGKYGSMPYSRPDILGFNRSLELESEGLKVNVPLKEILSFTFNEKGTITLLMKNGETGRVQFTDPMRIYGQLKTGEILFDGIQKPQGARIKSIEFPK